MHPVTRLPATLAVCCVACAVDPVRCSVLRASSFDAMEPFVVVDYLNVSILNVK